MTTYQIPQSITVNFDLKTDDGKPIQMDGTSMSITDYAQVSMANSLKRIADTLNEILVHKKGDPC